MFWYERNGAVKIKEDAMSDVQVIRREIECVSRASSGCDRNCGDCELVMEDSEIIRAYERAIRLIEAEDNGRIVELPAGNYTFTLKKDE